MKEVEKYIKKHIRVGSNISNGCYGRFVPEEYIHWLVPNDARKVAEIAREKTIKEVCVWLDNNLVNYLGLSPDQTYLRGAFIKVKDCINDLNKHLGR